MFPRSQVIHVDSAPSTNELAAEFLVSRSLSEGSVVVARNQTAGRGQFGSSWWSDPDKSLTASFVLYPTFLRLKELFALNMCVALAVRQVINDQTGRDTLVKWPNDIVCNGFKVCGILIENAINGDHIKHSIAGIGINVNQESFPVFLPHATSLKLLTGKTFDLHALLDALSNALAEFYLLMRHDLVKLKRLYHEHLFGVGASHTFSSGDQPFRAKLIGVTDEGNLDLELADGPHKTFAMKEVVLVQ